MYDRRLRELAKEALQMSSLVRVVGQLGRSRELNKEASMRTALHIRATNIFVSERRNQIAADYDGTNNERDSSPSRDHERKTAQKSAKAKSSRRVNRTIKDMMRQDYIVWKGTNHALRFPFANEMEAIQMGGGGDFKDKLKEKVMA